MAAISLGHFSMAGQLLEWGADVNVTTTSGQSALMLVAGMGNLELTRRLLSSGADTQVVRDGGIRDGGIRDGGVVRDDFRHYIAWPQIC